MKELTIREKAAIALYLTENKVRTSDLYLVGHKKSSEEVAGMKHLDSCASHWFSSPPVQEYIRTRSLRMADDQAKEREAMRRELLSELHADSGRSGAGIIDYSDPLNREKLYNEVIARSADDPKTQLDAAKMFEQIQKDNREAASTRQRQSRVYLPLRCESCPLYQKASEELKTQIK